jgi:GT2 family glycosyltransferase
VPVAVLIINYRSYADLDRALASLTPWLADDDEVIVVDQASDPGRLRAVVERHPRARPIALDTNVGFAAGINLAARHSTADALLWLNPDALVETPVLRVLETWLAQHPGTGAVGPCVLNENGTVQPSARRFPGVSTAFGGRTSWLTRRFPNNWFSRRNLSTRGATSPTDVHWLAGSCLMTPRSVFTRLGGLDERFFLYWEDADYCRRAARLGLRRTYVPSVHVRHLAGRSAAHDPAASIRAFHRSAAYLQRKHAGPVGRLAAPLVRAALSARAEALIWARRGRTR